MSENRTDRTKYCPECGSEDIDWIIPQTWSKWQCRSCGYIGPLVIEDHDLAEQIRNDHEEKLKKHD